MLKKAYNTIIVWFSAKGDVRIIRLGEGKDPFLQHMEEELGHHSPPMGNLGLLKKKGAGGVVLDRKRWFPLADSGSWSVLGA
jgi:hypothetical protein